MSWTNQVWDNCSEHFGRCDINEIEAFWNLNSDLKFVLLNWKEKSYINLKSYRSEWKILSLIDLRCAKAWVKGLHSIR